MHCEVIKIWEDIIVWLNSRAFSVTVKSFGDFVMFKRQ
jgi:hypothetical protein